jgi:guanylate kinase
MNTTTVLHGLLLIFTGTSGSGRKTIARRIAKELGLRHIISTTTRAPRSTELDGRDYRFITRETFEEMDQEGAFLQKADIDGEYYALCRKDVEAALAFGQHAYVIVNAAGADHLRRMYGNHTVRFFIYISKQALIERLNGHMPYEVEQRYLELYSEEVAYRKHCEHVFENLELSRTLQAVKSKVEAVLEAHK